MERYFLSKNDMIDVGYEIILEHHQYNDYIAVYDPYTPGIGIYHKYPKVWELEKSYLEFQEVNVVFAKEILDNYLRSLGMI